MSIARRVVTRYRVAARALEAGYYGWDPPDDEDELEAPTKEWEDLLDTLPTVLQRRIGKPEETRDRGRDQETVTLSGGADLSDDYDLEAGISLEVMVYHGLDADEEGLSGFGGDETSYELNAGNKSWHAKGHGYSRSKFEHDFREWSKVITEMNSGAAKALGLRS